MSQLARALFLAFVALAIAFAPSIGPLKRLSDALAGHPQPYLGIAVGLTVVGVALFAVVGLATALRGGRRMTGAEAQAYAAAGLRAPNYAVYRGYFRGRAFGQQVETTNSFRDIREAFRSGAWWNDSAWRRFLLTMAGALLWLYGGFGIALVIGPPAIKVIVGASLLYVSARLLMLWIQAARPETS
jgi:hypothetical protein